MGINTNTTEKFILELNGKEVFYGTLAECKIFELTFIERDSFTDIYGETHGVPKIERVIFQNPATIVFWKDGDKTVVKCDEGDAYWEHLGLANAIVKKAFGSRSNWVKHVRNLKRDIKDFPFVPEVNFDEFDLALHYVDKIYTENKFSNMVDRFMRWNEKQCGL